MNAVFNINMTLRQWYIFHVTIETPILEVADTLQHEAMLRYSKNASVFRETHKTVPNLTENTAISVRGI
jgi:hypothetical protein